jgi:hypothetical protein
LYTLASRHGLNGEGGDMKKIIPVLMIFSMIFSCASSGGILQGDSGTFRGRWYNYYNRGLAMAENANLDHAEKDLLKTISERNRDQWMARTYGMHYIDYFPHRELGIVYLSKGDIDRAVRELEVSISQAESAKAVFYLNRARRLQLINMDIRPAPPELVIHSPLDGSVMNVFSVKVKGTASGQGYVSKIFVNGLPYRFDRAGKTVEFEKEVAVDEESRKIIIASEDLLGNLSVKTISLMIDRDGPTINIFDILTEEINGREGVRITGEINDTAGIHNLLFNDEDMKVGDTKNYEFSILTERGSPSSKFTITAVDVLNNTTTAELDIDKELAALNDKSGPVLLAFKGRKLFSLDEKPPEISLKDGVDIPAVFVSKYYVEGEVSDNKRVEEILVNGKEISTRKGRKIFFSKVVKLDEGKNEIDVKAYDSSGNRTESDFTVTRNIPAAMQVGSRMSVSILPFDNKKNETSFTQLAYEQLIGSFVEQKRFSVIERTKLEKVLLEQKLTKEKLTDPKFSVKVGRLMAADTILATSVNETEKYMEFVSRVINTETSEVMEVKDVFSEDKSFSAVEQLMDGLASKIAGSFPLAKGMVIKKDKGYIYADIGSKEKIKKDMEVIVYRRGDEIKHPLTGKSLGWDTKNLGEGNIEEIHEGFSKAKLSDKPEAEDIKIQDMVITK